MRLEKWAYCASQEEFYKYYRDEEFRGHVRFASGGYTTYTKPGWYLFINENYSLEIQTPLQVLQDIELEIADLHLKRTEVRKKLEESEQ